MNTYTKEGRLAMRQAMIPKGAKPDPRNNEYGAAYTYEMNGRIYALGFRGSAGRSEFHYRYRSEERRAEAIDQFFDSIKQSKIYKAKRSAERKAASSGLEVGDILRSMWGYDQTNVDYYEVTKVLGKNKVEIREIGYASRNETGFMQGTCSPAPGKYIGDPMIKIARNGSVSLTSYSSASKIQPKMVDGQPDYGQDHWTAYA